jgi:hypothetical protein
MSGYVYNGSVKKQDNDDKDQKDKIYYKILNSDWTCRGYQYQLGETYSIPEEDLVLCQCGFHCCEHPLDCLEFYHLIPSNHYVEVKMLGKIVTSKGSYEPKCATNMLKIEREIPYEEWLELCTVTVRSGGTFPKEDDWVHGRLTERRLFYLNGNKMTVTTFFKHDASTCTHLRYTSLLKSMSYFPNGMEHESTTFHENGMVRMTEVWVPKEGNLECIRNTYDEQGKQVRRGE